MTRMGGDGRDKIHFTCNAFQHVSHASAVSEGLSALPKSFARPGEHHLACWALERDRTTSEDHLTRSQARFVHWRIMHQHRQPGSSTVFSGGGCMAISAAPSRIGTREILYTRRRSTLQPRALGDPSSRASGLWACHHSSSIFFFCLSGATRASLSQKNTTSQPADLADQRPRILRPSADKAAASCVP